MMTTAFIMGVQRPSEAIGLIQRQSVRCPLPDHPSPVARHDDGARVVPAAVGGRALPDVPPMF